MEYAGNISLCLIGRFGFEAELSLKRKDIYKEDYGRLSVIGYSFNINRFLCDAL